MATSFAMNMSENVKGRFLLRICNFLVLLIYDFS